MWGTQRHSNWWRDWIQIVALSAGWHSWGCILVIDAAHKMLQVVPWRVCRYRYCKMFVCCFCNTEHMLCLFTLITVIGETCIYETVNCVSFDTAINSFVVVVFFFCLSMHFNIRTRFSTSRFWFHFGVFRSTIPSQSCVFISVYCAIYKRLEITVGWGRR
jgi:hypothetical protein